MKDSTVEVEIEKVVRIMSDRCAGCTNKYKFFEKPTLCPHCQRSFCHSCLPPPPKKGKKSGEQIAQNTCVYCSRKHQQVKESEETEILQTFQERFYKHAHTEPPIQTRVQLDLSKTGKTDGVKLTEEDKALIERYKKLKEPKKGGEASFDEENVRDRLAKLRGESEKDKQMGGGGGGGGGVEGGASTGSDGDQPGKGTQVEQAQDLIEQMTDEVRIEGKLDEFSEDKEDELHQRFMALKGKKTAESSSSGHKQLKPPETSEIQQLLENMEVQIGGDEDPESLLEDLKSFQSKEERLALSEAQSADVLALVDKARELAAEEGQPDVVGGGEHLISGAKIQYPPISDLESNSATAGPTDNHKDQPGSGLKEDIANLIKDTAEEMEEDKVRQKEDLEFAAGVSDRLSELRSHESTDKPRSKVDNIAEDEEVRSKLHPKGPRKSLDFTWAHFGSGWSHSDQPPSSASPSAARQLGLALSGSYEEGGEDLNDDVQALLKEVMAEAELDRKLEKTGHGHYLESTKKPDDSAEKPAQPVKPDTKGGASVGATAAGYWSGGGRGYGDDDFDLPWCCICNEDATIQCYDCDGDLYCTRCFSEGHEQFGLFDHRYGPFEPQKKPM